MKSVKRNYLYNVLNESLVVIAPQPLINGENHMLKLIIGADIVPTKSNQKIFENAQIENIVDSRLLDLLRNANYRIFNLEVPLTDIETPIDKCGPNLAASARSAAGYKQLGIDFLTLANNHILDQGEQGLWSTAEQLDKWNIAYAGIGHTLTEASQPYIAEIADKKVGIYCCAEHEFSIATENKAGANPFDPFESLDHIASLKSVCDYVICLYHGGKEHYRYPSPLLQKTCRKIVEKGADLVICQHTHCIGCEEKWQKGTIVYGQGNFLFDDSDSEYWKTAVLVEVELKDKSINYIPILKKGNGVKLADSDEAKIILSEMKKRTDEIKQEGFIEKTYRIFSKKMIEVYLADTNRFTGSFLFRALNKISGRSLGRYFTRKKIKRDGNVLINQYACEAHRELILKGLEVFEK
ncbi:MAG: CapA family protein [Sphaerochaeta sp.]